MNKIELKENIWIKGFDEEDGEILWHNHMWWDNYRGLSNYELIYSGKTCEIPEELSDQLIGDIDSSDYFNKKNVNVKKG